MNSPTVQAVLAAAVIGAIYLRWTPQVPDLAAQVARADVARDVGQVTWWTGWFGGLSTPTYSVLTPMGMALLGVGVIGVISVLITTAALSQLMLDAPRARLGSFAVAAAATADLLAGRVTFCAGVAVGAVSLLALSRRSYPIAVACAVLAYLASPLAGLFLGLIALAIGLCDPVRRRCCCVIGALLLIMGGGSALLFPGTGTMPFGALDMVPAGLGLVAVVVGCWWHRLIRVATLVCLAALPVFFAFPGAVGNNITRLAWVFAVPMLVAYGRLPRRYLALAIVVVSIWPSYDLVQQLRHSQDVSTTPAYYRPLQAALNQDRAQAGAAAVGARLEVVDSASHWASVYLVHTAPLARGWDRQADYANNPIFYRAGELTDASYRQWLDDMAVRWVAVPKTVLDYASVREEALIARGPDYLEPVWADSNWTLYHVVDAVPLATGAVVQAVDPAGVTLVASAAGDVVLRARWSPYLQIQLTDGTVADGTCVVDAAGWLTVRLPAAGTYRVTSAFDPAHLQASQSCPQPTTAARGVDGP